MKQDELITSDDILGKEIIDSTGEILGVIQKLHIDKQKKEITGVTIDQGFMRPDLFIGLEYIKQFGIDTVFLNTYPKEKIIGMNVIDKNGKQIGHVTDIDYKSKNKIRAIKVKHGVIQKINTINIQEIKEIGYNVILK